ncbi:MAG: hypothetical protein WBN75_12115 [Verrucomicrobiia bacterium]
MKIRLVIWLSLTLNLALAAGICRLPKSPAAPVPVATAAHPTAVASLPSPSPADGSAPQETPFRWSQAASENLKIYRDNLRAIGCPEPTLREIIHSEINERFGARRRSILAAFQNQFWDRMRRGEFMDRRRRVQMEGEKLLVDLSAERQKLIADVLGQDALTTEVERQSRRVEQERRLSWLSPEKRAKLIELEAQHQQLLAEWAGSIGLRVNGVPTSEDEDRIQKLQQEFEDAEKQLLTPEELDELRLRESDVADWAGSLPGFEPSEDAWRSMTEARAEYEAAQRNLSDPGLSDEDRARLSQEADSRFQDQLKAALGDDQYAQYQRASNEQFQDLYNVAERYGLPDDVAVQAFQIQQTALAQAKQVSEDPNLSPEARQSALTAIEQETERTLSGTLGANAFSTYKQLGSSWLQAMVPPQ